MADSEEKARRDAEEAEKEYERWRGAIAGELAERGGEYELTESYDYESAFRHGRSPRKAVRDIQAGRQLESKSAPLLGEKEEGED